VNDQQSTIDTYLGWLGHKAAMGGALTSLMGWALSDRGTATIGILIGLTGLAVQIFYKRRQDQREQAHAEREQQEHELRMTLRRDTRNETP
jgi:uncharacterized membrane protein YebE (DUF533 family)